MTSSARSVILGTAGHIDHGKTTLIKALTGIDTDRLKEEKRRGITIELGFAHLELDDFQFGIVDVPGHERFIKSMVAGAGGIDIVMLVIAADEGVMPQTREHLDICSLLNVKHGIVALTKADLVDAEWLDLVRDDLQKTLSKTFLEDAPIIPCSGATGIGMDSIKSNLKNIASTLSGRNPNGLLRLPLDRVFSLKGFGTIVTGTLISGTLRVGDEVCILPNDTPTTVRRIQVHGKTVDHAVAGQRTAVNVGGVDRNEVSRGEVLVYPDTLAPSSMIDTRVRLLPHVRTKLKQRSKVLFNLGTRQQEATCVLLGKKTLSQGEETLAQLRFETPVVALPYDRFIIRGFAKQKNYGTTIGGGTVERVLSSKIRPRDKSSIAHLQRTVDSSQTDRIAHEVFRSGTTGLTTKGLQTRLPFSTNETQTALQLLLNKATIIRFERDSGAVIHKDFFQHLTNRAIEITRKFHQENPIEIGIGKEELRSRLGRNIKQRLFAKILGHLEKDKRLVVNQDLCHSPNHRPKIANESLGPLTKKAEILFANAGLAPPRDFELAKQLNTEISTVNKILKLLIDETKLIRLSATLVFWRKHVDDLGKRLMSHFDQNETITPSQFKEMVGQSRKFTIPLAEYFDAQKITLRVGDVRKLRQ